VPASERARELASAAAQAAADKAEQIVILGVGDQLVITDLFLLAAAPGSAGCWRSSTRSSTAGPAGEGEAGAPGGRADRALGPAGLCRHRRACPTHRQEFYALDRLWKDCPTVRSWTRPGAADATAGAPPATRA
jgi:ribosome-associated protein